MSDGKWKVILQVRYGTATEQNPESAPLVALRQRVSPDSAQPSLGCAADHSPNPEHHLVWTGIESNFRAPAIGCGGLQPHAGEPRISFSFHGSSGVPDQSVL